MDPFHVEPEAIEHWRRESGRWQREEEQWTSAFDAYRQDYPEQADEFEALMAGGLPRDGTGIFRTFRRRRTPHEATPAWCSRPWRKRCPTWVGGSADLGGSNKTDIKGGGDLLPDSPEGRGVHFGVREHAMGALMNGMALHGGLRPFGGTFLIFSDYMRPAIRLAALMKLPVTYVFTHDSIGLGEDGPTHQPVEQLMSLRAIPGLLDLRPADGSETVEAWRAALSYREGPSFLSLTRQKVPGLEQTAAGGASGLHRGAYVLSEAKSGRPDCIVVASGSEVHLALEAQSRLAASGVAVRS